LHIMEFNLCVFFFSVLIFIIFDYLVGN